MSTNSTKLEPRGVNTDATFNFANLSVTSNVTTANLTVSGKSNLGEISNVTVTGGASGQVVQTDGSGGLSWVDVSSIVGQAAGPGNSIQFNDAGSINGDSKLKFNKTSGVLSVTGNVEASYFSGNGSLLSNVTGANVTGFVSNATHANSATTSTTATTAGTVTSNAQPNITSIGTLSTLSVTDTITSVTISATDINGKIKTATQNEITSLGTLTGLAVSGTTTTGTLTATNINGTIKTASQPEITGIGTLTALTVSGIGNISTLRTDIIQYSNGATYQFAMTPPGLDTQITFNDLGEYASSSNLVFNKTTKTLTVDNIISNGSQLTNVPAGNLTGTIPDTVLGNSTFYIGTTSIKANRASTSQSLTGITSIDGSAARLTTARNINGISFDGTGDITVTANAETLTGTTLKSTIVDSSLTSVGTLTQLNVSGNSSFTSANVSLGGNANVRITGGTDGAVLSTDGAGNLSWTSVPVIPALSGQSGNFLTTNGSTLSWVTLGSVTLPSTSGQSGKYLTNDGTTSLWASGAVATTSSFTNGTSNIVIPTSSGPVRTYVGSTLKLDVNSTNVLINGTQLSINIATGTAPLEILSTTRVANLNVAKAGQTDSVLVNAGEGAGGIYFVTMTSGKNNGYYSEYGSAYLTAEPSTGSVTSTGNVTASRLISTVLTTSTVPPIYVSSTVRVANLNVAKAGQTDSVLVNAGEGTGGIYFVTMTSGKNNGYYSEYGSAYLTAEPSTGSVTSTGTITASKLVSTVVTGTTPMTVTSTTRVTNLNVDKSGQTDSVLVNAGEGAGGIYFVTMTSGKNNGYYSEYGSAYLTAEPSTGNVTSTGTITASRLISTVLTTTNLPPMYISSTVRVANLNVAKAGQTDSVLVNAGEGAGGSYFINMTSGKNNGYYSEYGSAYLTAEPSNGNVTSTGTITASRLISTVATGTVPIIVTSTTRVSNLNVDKSGKTDSVLVNAGEGAGGIYFVTMTSGKNNGYYSEYGSAYLTAEPSTGNVTSTGTIQANIISISVAVGTPPLYVTSTTRVANLNVAKSGQTDSVLVNSGEGTAGSYFINMTGGRSGGYYTEYGTSYLTAEPSTGNVTSTGTIRANTMAISVATGTPPLDVSSTTRVNNLNVAKSGQTDSVLVNSGEGVAGTQYLVASTNKAGGYYNEYGSAYLTTETSTGNVTSTGTIRANTMAISVATGTPPLDVSSTTRVNNLNVARANISDFTSVTTQSTSTYYPVFASGATTSNYALGSNTALKFDAATGNLQTTVVYVTANITSGNASLGNLVGANYVSLTNNITTPNASIGNITSNISLLGWTTIQKSTELMVSPSFASTIICDLDTSSIFYISPTSNFTVNFTNVPTTINRTIVVTLILAQTTGYYASAVQIGGAGQTIKWSYGSTPVPTANKTEIETITLIRTSGGAWVVLGDYGTYG